MSAIGKIFKEYQENKRYIEVSIHQMKQELGSQADKICLYGAGSAGIAFLYYLRNIGIEPKYFVDMNEKRWGTICEGLEIIAPEQIVDCVGTDALVIVTINTDGKRYCKSFDEALRVGGHAGVHKMLREYGIQSDIDYTYFRRVHELFDGDPYNLPSCSDVSCILNHQREIEFVYEHLADDVSRDVFLKILQFRLIDDTLTIPTLPQDKQYFEREFYHKRKDEVFVDCGAFNGISAKAFLLENGKQFDAYYGFEPDKANFEALQQYVGGLPDEIRLKMHIYNVAVWKGEGGARFYSLKGPGSFIADIGHEAVQTLTLDKALDGNKPTYIKMNIEGSEIQALQGAKRTIEKYRPKLAIAGYHKTWDMWEIPNLIIKYNASYKIYLRSYMNHISFVYYCL
ncbi:MAG: FkbM family methyltransferase [Muribaculaceae bacterium]|nr:FkbM family methyltransferase [Roseburia sp.]MCM1429848.1 FkbM family methyltransferase [Muribaculaceae bacterium]MCM1492899.1 FkbM family methyltransferase [Muribaculaceae bacterium]